MYEGGAKNGRIKLLYQTELYISIFSQNVDILHWMKVVVLVVILYKIF